MHCKAVTAGISSEAANLTKRTCPRDIPGF
jgi:hypothetical protein